MASVIRNRQYLIILTACIDPRKEGPRLARSDCAVRLQDYIAGLRFWLAHSDPRLRNILFIDNSGFDLASLAEVVKANNPFNKDVEFIQTGDNHIPEGVHYGYGELSMLDYSMTHSSLLKKCDYMIKATGRLKFPGLPKLLERLPEHFDFAVDCRNNTKFVRLPQVFLTTQLMIFSTRFYAEHLLGIKSELNSEVQLIENLLYNRLICFKGKPGAVLRWPVNVSPVGNAAHWKKNYGSLKQQTINCLRSGCRRLFPDWWV